MNYWFKPSIDIISSGFGITLAASGEIRLKAHKDYTQNDIEKLKKIAEIAIKEKVQKNIIVTMVSRFKCIDTNTVTFKNRPKRTLKMEVKTEK